MAKDDPPDPNRKNRDSDQASGRKIEDSQGRSVWKFAVESGKHFIDSTSSLLRRLDVPGLKIDDEARPGGKVSGAPGGGYDPYGSNKALNTKQATKPKVYVSRPTAPKPAPVEKSPPPSLLKRLFRRD
ncbi:MAG TPA: hypothetical protein VF848_08155 [Steroidobacteraceae bacterium]